MKSRENDQAAWNLVPIPVKVVFAVNKATSISWKSLSTIPDGNITQDVVLVEINEAT